jgi:hypothetical protein
MGVPPRAQEDRKDGRLEFRQSPSALPQLPVFSLEPPIRMMPPSWLVVFVGAGTTGKNRESFLPTFPTSCESARNTHLERASVNGCGEMHECAQPSAFGNPLRTNNSAGYARRSGGS